MCAPSPQSVLQPAPSLVLQELLSQEYIDLGEE
jgi:hypothetical protein